MKFSCSHGFVELWIDESLFCVSLLFEIYGVSEGTWQFQSINCLDQWSSVSFEACG